MKVQQEIIEAKYSITDLTLEEYNLLKDGLHSIINLIDRDAYLAQTKVAETGAYKLAKRILSELN